MYIHLKYDVIKLIYLYRLVDPDMKIGIIGNGNNDLRYDYFYEHVNFLLKGNIHIDEIVSDEMSLIGQYVKHYAGSNKTKFKSVLPDQIINEVDRLIVFSDTRTNSLIAKARRNNKLFHVFLIDGEAA